MEFLEALRRQLESKGFQSVIGKEGRIYWRAENPVLYVLCLTEGEQWQREREEFHTFAKEIPLEKFFCTRLVALSVLVCHAGNSVELAHEEPTAYSDGFFPVLWQVSAETGQVQAPAGQPDRLLGIEKLILAAAKGEEPEVLTLREEREFPVVTAVIFLLCVGILVWMNLSGRREEMILQYGLSRQGILAGQYYRFFTSMFLHAGWKHLISNGVFLYYFGIRSEWFLGKGRFLVLYLFAGLCGGLCSVLLGNGGLSVGASGAIYGLLGAMLLLTKKWGPAVTEMNYATMLLLALLSISFGFLEMGVDNLAHIGGFLGGVILVALFPGRND